MKTRLGNLFPIINLLTLKLVHTPVASHSSVKIENTECLKGGVYSSWVITHFTHCPYRLKENES